MLPQRFLGRDLFWWMTRLGLMTKTSDSRLAQWVRAKGDLVIGTRWSDLARLGIQGRPRLESTDGRRVSFADGSVTGVAAWCGRPGSAATNPGSTCQGPLSTTRSRMSGASPGTGLSVLGLPWLHTRGSALLGLVKDDAAWLADPHAYRMSRNSCLVVAGSRQLSGAKTHRPSSGFHSIRPASRNAVSHPVMGHSPQRW